MCGGIKSLMDMKYTETTLWKTAFSLKNDGNDTLRLGLIEKFKITRRNAEFLLNKIREDFPSLTIHDITHVDALWQVASVIAGQDYFLNPLEGFILGCAFLMHDAALSYYSVGGVKCLRSTIEWKDYYEDYSVESSFSEDEKLYETDFKTIRLLHAKNAENLYRQLFGGLSGTRFYIIDDDTLRNHCGKLICKIAASHHWNIDKLLSLERQIPALAGYPQEWRINPIKLACLLRCADAGHIDAGRAPDYLLKLLDINGVSRNHWIAQNRLLQIDNDITDKRKVIIASSVEFEEDDFAAWNVAYDAVQVLDHEIKSSNMLLESIDASLKFQAECVCGAESRQALSKYIKTHGWNPCNAVVHIGNVESLIKNLGGEKLYGSKNQIEIVLRELIQNARDAIVARRERENNFQGRIDIVLEESEDKQWIKVKDNGVGMSLQTINDYLLNFGASFWASDLAKSEFPGLRASMFKSIGTFGIGFYSVFMVATDVIVETRKYDQGLDTNKRLKFPKGLCLRPILSEIQGENMNVSTVISCCLNSEKFQWKDYVEIEPGIMGISKFKVPYLSVLSRLTAGLDVDVFFTEKNKIPKLVHRNINSQQNMCEWLKEISYAPYHEGNKYISYIENNYNRVRNIKYNGHIYGAAALNTLYQSHPTYLGLITVGGLDADNYSSGNYDFMGYVLTNPTTAKREGELLSLTKIMSSWANEQYKILLEQGLSDLDRLKLPYIICKYEIDMKDEMYIRFYNKDHSARQANITNVLIHLKKYKHKLILPLSGTDNYRISSYTDFDRTLKMLGDDEYLFIPEMNSNFLDIKETGVNLFLCLKQKSMELGFNFNSRIDENKVYDTFFKLSGGLIIWID